MQPRSPQRLPAGLAVAVLSFLLSACGGGTSTPSAQRSSAAPAPGIGQGANQSPVAVESNPPGDIPDSVAFVTFVSGPGRYRFSHPEGWLQLVKGTAMTLIGKLDGAYADVGPRTAPPTPAQAQQDVSSLKTTQSAFELVSVTSANLPGGRGILIVYRRNSDPDPVTGRQYRDEVQRYEVVAGGREVVLELWGPVGSDNVDAFRTVSQSLRIG